MGSQGGETNPCTLEAPKKKKKKALKVGKNSLQVNCVFIWVFLRPCVIGVACSPVPQMLLLLGSEPVIHIQQEVENHP